MIDIQQSRLGTLEQDLFLSLSGFGEEVGCLAHDGAKALDERRDLFEDLIGSERLITEENDDAIGLFKISLDAQLKYLGRHRVCDTNAATAGFVFVSGADAAEGGADAFIAETFLRSM